MPANPDRIAQAFNYFTSKGWTPAQASGIVGHGMAESNLNPGIEGDSGAALGLFQWNDRRPQAEAWIRSTGRPVNDFQAQLEFAQHELETSESYAASQLRAATNPVQAAAAFMHFERPQGYSRDNPVGGHNWAGRKANAEQVFNAMASGSYPSMGTGYVNASTVTPNANATPGFIDPTQPRQPWSDVEQNQAQAKTAAAANPYGFGEALNQSAEKESVLYWMGQGAKTMPDPNWNPTREDLKRLQEGIPEHLQAQLGDAHSAGHAEQIRQKILDDMTYEKRMADGGWRTNGVARTLGALSDPVGLGLMVLAPEIGLPAKAGLLGRVGLRALEAGATNVALDVPRYLNKPTAEGSDLIWAAGTGMALGGLVGAVARNPAVREEADALVGAGKRMQARAETELQTGVMDATRAGDGLFPVAPSGGSAGAMANSPREVLTTTAEDWLHSVVDEAIDRSAMSKVRWDIAGKGKASDNAATRAFIGNTVVDVVGNADKSRVVQKAAEEWQKQLDFDFTQRAFKTHQETVTDYASRQAERNLSKNEIEVEFRREVTRYLDDRQLGSDFDPAVKKAGDMQRKLYADWLDYMKEPGRLDGTVRRAVGGAENIEHDPHYRPNLADHEKIDGLSVRFGDDTMRQAISQIFRLRAPELEEGLADKMAKGYWRRLREAGAGMQDLDHALRGHDLDRLKDTLAGLDLDEKEVERIVGIVSPKPQENAGNARLKRRALYQNDSEVQLRDKNGEAVPFRMSDLFQDDYLSNFRSYSRSMSGQISMAMVQVKNPLWHELADEKVPRFLIDGISNKNDFEKVVRDMRAVWDAKTDLPMKVRNAKADADEARMRFVYDRITGVPDKFDSTKLGQIFRAVKDYNFMRVMNQVGFAQLGEMMGITTQFGLKASVEGIPAFKAMLRDIKTGELKDAFAREIEELSGQGADFFRDGFRIHLDDAGAVLNRTGQSQLSTKIENAMHTGKRVTSVISGMAPVDAFSRRWASAAAVQKIVNAAATGGEAGLKKLNPQRMAALGLDKDMTKRVFDQIRKHATWADGEVSSRKYRTGNFTKWDDQEALSHFRDAIWRWSRTAIQEPHLGQTSVLLSSPMGRFITQFRTFMLGAWTNQFLRNLHVRDWNGFSTWLMTSVVGGAVYAAQQHLNSIGRSDRDKFLEDRLSPKKMALAMVQRGDWSSIMPTVFDTGAHMLGFTPAFDTRASNTASSIFGSPSADLFKGSFDAVHGLTRAAREGGLSQGDVRKVLRVLPYGNAIAPIPLLNSMIRGLPERAPMHDRKN